MIFSGRTLSPSFATSPFGVASQLAGNISGVSKSTSPIIQLSVKVFPETSGGAGFPSSDMLSQVPGVWSRKFPGPQMSEKSIAQIKILIIDKYGTDL